LDLPDLLRSVADSLRPLAYARFVRIDLAVSPGRTVRTSPDVLKRVLRETVAGAIDAAAGGQVLVSVLPLDTQLHIVITDDGACCVPGIRESTLRGAAELIALVGGTVAVVARPGRGTTVTLRLPVPAVQPTAIETLAEVPVLEAEAV
jgi:signal transduction histidine kinase